jgi:hypothetical protein
MTKTQTQTHDTGQTSAERMLDELDPATDQMRDGRYLRAVAAARQAAEDAKADLQAAVDTARAHGDSWEAIAVVLRTSRQNAHRKFSHG